MNIEQRLQEEVAENARLRKLCAEVGDKLSNRNEVIIQIVEMLKGFDIQLEATFNPIDIKIQRVINEDL